MEGDMDSITKADGMEGVRVVGMPGYRRVLLDEDTMNLLAEALEITSTQMRVRAAEISGHSDSGHGAWVVDTLRAKAARLELLAAVVDEAEILAVDVNMYDEDGDKRRKAAVQVTQALVDAGAQA
jgi:hypothetical protein